MKKDMPSSLDRYRELVREMIRDNDVDLLDNISTAHARIIVQELLRYARTTVNIVCTKLSEDVWDDPETLDALREAVAGNKGLSIRIATKAPFPEAWKFVTLAKQYRARFFNVPDANVPDFCVVDGLRFRVEVDREKREAQVCFHNRTLGGLLDDIFEQQTRAIEQP